MMLRTAPSSPRPVAVAKLLPDPAAPAKCHQMILVPHADATINIVANNKGALIVCPKTASTASTAINPLDAANIK